MRPRFTSHPAYVVTLCLMVSVGSSVTGDDGESSGTLTWNNDDAIQGQLVSYDEGFLKWNSNQFSAPLEVDFDVISSVEFQRPSVAVEPAGQFRVETSTGGTFFGDLASINDQTVTLEGGRFGSVTLGRSYVRELRQLKHTQVLYDGPRWLDGWRVLKAGRMVSEWKPTEHGHLTTEKYGGELYHDLPELDVAEINLVLRWTGKPGFQIDFSPPTDLVSTRPRPRLSLKSWGDDVVATSSLAGTDFQHLLKLKERQLELRLRIVWDSKVGEAVIHGQGGRVLGRVIVDTDNLTQFGVLVKNRSDDLTIEKIRVSKWNGVRKSEEVAPGKEYIRLSNGELVVKAIRKVEGTVVELDDGTQFELDELAVAEFAATGTADFQPHHIRFFDGTEFSGEIQSIDENAMVVKVAPVKEAIASRGDQIESIRCFQGRTDRFEFHLVGEGNKLSGNLRPVPDTQALGWAPIGARNPVPIRVGTTQTIERRMGHAEEGAPQGDEVIYLKDESVVIGQVTSIDDHSVQLNTPYSGARSVSIDHVRAVEMLRRSGRVSFTDANWEFLREARPIQRAQERLEVSEPISMRDLSLFHGGKVTFSCSWDQDFVGLLTIHMGTATKQPRNSLVRFTFSQNRVAARSLINATAPQTLPPVADRRATVSMDATGGKFIVWVNGIKAFETEVKRQIENKGLWIQCGSARGGAYANGRTGRKPRLIIDRLRVGDAATAVGAGFASARDLEMILRLPRNRVNSAPACVLCSSNGDLLRGSLVGVSNEEVEFKSRYEVVQLPRDEVSALVWLRKFDGATSEPAAAESLRVTLRDGSVVFAKAPRIEGDALVCEHALLTECRLPIQQILKIENGKAEWQSVTSVVDWKLEKTPEPKFSDEGAGQGLDSLLIGQSLENVVIPMKKGGSVRLGDENKIVILDFWASWCAPCIRSLPKLVNLASTFPPDRVRLIAVNQEETPFTIDAFLANRDLDMQVGLDADAALASKLGIKTIPQTVIVGPDGKIARHFVGAPADLHESIFTAVKELLPPSD